MSLTGEVAHALITAQTAAFTSQHASGKGPLTLLDRMELKHWMTQLCFVTQAALAAQLRSAVHRFARRTEEDAQSGTAEVRHRLFLL